MGNTRWSKAELNMLMKGQEIAGRTKKACEVKRSKINSMLSVKQRNRIASEAAEQHVQTRRKRISLPDAVSVLEERPVEQSQNPAQMVMPGFENIVPQSQTRVAKAKVVRDLSKAGHTVQDIAFYMQMTPEQVSDIISMTDEQYLKFTKLARLF